MPREAEWVRACTLSELEVGGVHVLKHGATHVALFRPSDEELYAVDNHCPHEGYPLAKGWVKECVVTCPWHNFKFDLRDGNCVMGDEAVRTFPLRLSEGHIELDVSGPDPAVERARALASLEEAMRRRKLGQAAREIVRLLAIETPASDVALAVASFDARYAEYGTSHALPIAVDGLTISDRFPAEQKVLPLMQAVDMAADVHRLRTVRAVPEAVAPGSDPAAAGERLRQLVEREDAHEAEALFRGALQAGWGRDVVEPWLYQLCADHFLDFGHALIYQVKVFDLLEAVGWKHAATLLPAHLFRIVNGTREDCLPEWLWLRRRLEALEPRHAELCSGRDTEADPAPLIHALLDADRERMIDTVVGQLESGLALPVLVNAISIAAAHRMLRFSVAIDADPTLQDGWLDVTHLLTYANALRHAVKRYREPDALRLVLFGCRFVNNARPLDEPPELRLDFAAAPEAELGDILAAVTARDAERAVQGAAAWLSVNSDPSPLRNAFEDVALADGLVRPIVVGHLIKTTLAAFEEYGAHGDMTPVLALTRLAASPVSERRVQRAAHEALRFVIEGKVPRTLT